jgi:hypothetical protein
MNEADGAFCTAGSHLVKPAGVVHWIHTIMVRPVPTYSSTVWWPRVRYRAQEVTEMSTSGHNRRDEGDTVSCNGGSSVTSSSSCDD